MTLPGIIHGYRNSCAPGRRQHHWHASASLSLSVSLAGWWAQTMLPGPSESESESLPDSEVSLSARRPVFQVGDRTREQSRYTAATAATSVSVRSSLSLPVSHATRLWEHHEFKFSLVEICQWTCQWLGVLSRWLGLYKFWNVPWQDHSSDSSLGTHPSLCPTYRPARISESHHQTWSLAVWLGGVWLEAVQV